MDDFTYTPNSHKYKEEQRGKETEKKKVEKVVKGVVKTKKKTEIRKFADIFLAEDFASVKSYILMDVLVPGIKRAVSDIVTNSLDMLLFGESNKNKKSSGVSYISYRNYSDKKDTSDNTRTRTGYNYDDIVLESRGEAEEVIIRMEELIETYGSVSVADLYDLVGKQCNYTDNKYGWINVRNAEPIRVRDGYLLKLPKAMPI